MPTLSVPEPNLITQVNKQSLLQTGLFFRTTHTILRTFLQYLIKIFQAILKAFIGFLMLLKMPLISHHNGPVSIPRQGLTLSASAKLGENRRVSSGRVSGKKTVQICGSDDQLLPPGRGSSRRTTPTSNCLLSIDLRSIKLIQDTVSVSVLANSSDPVSLEANLKYESIFGTGKNSFVYI